ncbi:hypothetical protein [Pseudomonas citronellolis]|uniref:hypothetical protein n=1 Tax=Pseudomonas citronellolis TaxID=53408 RepID=UPI00248DB7E2|nr:hypothetical protein [Pseudomonas citronellolis]
MDVYKLRVEHIGGKPIDKDAFEAETRCRKPWYRPGSTERDSQFAVCPACDDPIQLIGLYELPANITKPFGKHVGKSVPGLAISDPEARQNCPYFNPKAPSKTARKKHFDGVPAKIIQLLIEQFDRVVYVLEKQTGIELSKKALRGMLERYKGERGFMYAGATLRNVPWIFAYMSDATDLFMQRVDQNSTLKQAINEGVEGAQVGSEGRVGKRVFPSGQTPPFFDLKVSFIHHRIRKDSDDGGVFETMTLVVSVEEKRQLRDIHKQDIVFEYGQFERLIQLPEGKGRRRMDLVELAREVLGDLLG